MCRLLLYHSNRWVVRNELHISAKCKRTFHWLLGRLWKMAEQIFISLNCIILCEMHFYWKGHPVAFSLPFQFCRQTHKYVYIESQHGIRWLWMSPTIFVCCSYKNVFGLIRFSTFLFNWYIRCDIHILSAYLCRYRSKYELYMNLSVKIYL